MRRLLTVLFLTILTSVAFAQQNYQDVVYLKNGSIIRGMIIELVPNKSIKIETADKTVFEYQIAEIEKLTREMIQGNSNYSSNKTGRKTGYKGIVEFGYQIGVGSYSRMDRLTLNIINGYQFGPYFSLGIGTGLRYYYDIEKKIIPIFADFRANLNNTNVSQYLSLGIGYSANATNDFGGEGFLLNPTMGVCFKVSEKLAMNVGIGYELQRMNFHYYPFIMTENVGAISINVGISF